MFPLCKEERALYSHLFIKKVTLQWNTVSGTVNWFYFSDFKSVHLELQLLCGSEVESELKNNFKVVFTSLQLAVLGF